VPLAVPIGMSLEGLQIADMTTIIVAPSAVVMIAGSAPA
jgi:hypothetical protein